MARGVLGAVKAFIGAFLLVAGFIAGFRRLRCCGGAFIATFGRLRCCGEAFIATFRRLRCGRVAFLASFRGLRCGGGDEGSNSES